MEMQQDSQGKARIDKQVSDRIAMVRFIMVVGVVFVHASSSFSMSAIGAGWFNDVQAFFSHAVFRTSVPLLTLISGYLLFSAGLDRQPATLWAKKARTVGLPFVVFNCWSISVFFLVQQVFPDAIMRIDLLHSSRYDWINAFFAVMDAPFNYPLYFLRDMLVLALLAPLFGWLLRTAPSAGLVLVTLVFYFNYDHYLIIRNTSAIMFYLGGLLAVKKCNLLKLDRHAPRLLALFLAICLVITILRTDDVQYVVFAGPFLLWPAFRYLSSTQLGNRAAACSKYSFFIFIAHAPVLQLARLAYEDSLQVHIAYGVFWLLAPVALVLALIAVQDMAMQTVPVFFKVITGGRVVKPKPDFVERRRSRRPANAPVFSNEMRMAMRAGFEAELPAIAGEGQLS